MITNTKSILIFGRRTSGFACLVVRQRQRGIYQTYCKCIHSFGIVQLNKKPPSLTCIVDSQKQRAIVTHYGSAKATMMLSPRQYETASATRTQLNQFAVQPRHQLQQRLFIIQNHSTKITNISLTLCSCCLRWTASAGRSDSNLCNRMISLFVSVAKRSRRVDRMAAKYAE